MELEEEDTRAGQRANIRLDEINEVELGRVFTRQVPSNKTETIRL